MTQTIEKSRHSRWTWSVAALLVLLLAVLWFAGRGPGGICCGSAVDTAATTPSASTPAALAPAPPMQSASKKPGSFAVRIDGDKRVLEGTVSDQATRDHLLQTAGAVYGETNVVDKLAVDPEASTSKCAEKADALFAAVKTDPPIGVACDANGGVTLTGNAISEADKASRERWARDFFGADAALANAIQVVAPLQPVTRPEDVRCGARMPAAVTFATASSRIDSRGRKLLDAIVPCLKEGKYEIAGHTDSIGSAEDNMHLSKARAESVRAYVILKGVDADRLVAIGYGAEHPIGDNGTSHGRASNRRIEFARK
jgi:outer membrane protein OmpA-like peptidoglycan-associated protein